MTDMIEGCGVVSYEDLDPGIRETVRWLNQQGFITCDSGDGVSKFHPDSPWYAGEETQAADVPHVIMRVDAHQMVSVADALADALRREGIPLGPIGPGDDDDPPHIQAGYDPMAPEGHRAVVLLVGVDDAMMRACGVIQGEK